MAPIEETLPTDFLLQSKLWSLTKCDVVELFLASEVYRRNLKKGERFPLSEVKIAEALGVKRSLVNRAWKALADKKVVRVKQGSGVIIQNPKYAYPDKDTLLAHFEVRKIAETALAHLAVTNANESDIKSIHEAAEEFKAAAEDLDRIDQLNATPASGFREQYALRLFNADTCFHITVREASKSHFLRIQCELAENVTEIVRLSGLQTPSRKLKDTADVHYSIYKGIAARDQEQVDRAMQEHFKIAEAYFKPSD